MLSVSKRRMVVVILTCIVGMWLAPASAGEKFNPNQTPSPNVKPPTVPPVVPPPVVQPPPPVITPPPPTSPPAPAGGPVIAPVMRPGSIPVDPTGGQIGDRTREAGEALRGAKEAGNLDKDLGLDAVMGAGPDDDSAIGPSSTPVDTMEELCKRASFRRIVRGLGICAGSDAGGLPPDGDLSDFYDTKRPVPGDSMSFDGPTAGSGVPGRDGRAGDDKDPTSDDYTGRKPDRSWTDAMGQQHNQYEDSARDGQYRVTEEVYSTDGTRQYVVYMTVYPDLRPGAPPGRVYVYEATFFHDNSVTERRRTCLRGRCTDVQPGESGYGQEKAKAWFCARNPKAKGCEPVAPGSHIDPASPDGEGTPTGTRPAAHRLGNEAVSDPGPADSEIRGVSGGGSEPLDIVDPIDPGGPGR